MPPTVVHRAVHVHWTLVQYVSGPTGRQRRLDRLVGWSGNGVEPSVVGGRILASLVLGRDDAWSRTPLVDRLRERFPPEPVRFLGAKIVRAAVIRKERAEAAGREPGRLDVRLAGLASAGLEDKEAPVSRGSRGRSRAAT
jgi:hypothetical protein